MSCRRCGMGISDKEVPPVRRRRSLTQANVRVTGIRGDAAARRVECSFEGAWACARLRHCAAVHADAAMPLPAFATVLIAGAGDLGLRLAQRRALRGDAVLALRRQASAVDGVHANVRAVAADVVNGEGLAALPRRVDALVFCAAPDRREEAAYRALFIDGLQRVLDAVQAARIVFVSSTAVYGEDAGEWVDEATPPRPTAFNGRVLLEAEARVHAAGGSALRPSGLYGPGRTMLLRRAQEGMPGRRHWTNRIHLDDAAAALDALLDRDRLEPVYCASDDAPALEREVLAWMREREGLPPVAPLEGPETGRRVSNTRLRGTGWAPRHPDWRSGYASLLGDRDGPPDAAQ